MSGKYVLKKAAGGQFMFNLKAGNGEIVLTSELYTTKASAQNGISAVKMNAPMTERFEHRTSKANEPYFVLKAANHEIIGTSEMYSSTAARDKGVDAVKANAQHSATEELV